MSHGLPLQDPFTLPTSFPQAYGEESQQEDEEVIPAQAVSPNCNLRQPCSTGWKLAYVIFGDQTTGIYYNWYDFSFCWVHMKLSIFQGILVSISWIATLTVVVGSHGIMAMRPMTKPRSLGNFTWKLVLYHILLSMVVFLPPQSPWHSIWHLNAALPMFKVAHFCTHHVHRPPLFTVILQVQQVWHLHQPAVQLPLPPPPLYLQPAALPASLSQPHTLPTQTMFFVVIVGCNPGVFTSR